jgi:hypothetical protein
MKEQMASPPIMWGTSATHISLIFTNANNQHPVVSSGLPKISGLMCCRVKNKYGLSRTWSSDSPFPQDAFQGVRRVKICY